MIDGISGTLVLYDSENISIPIKKGYNYKVVKVDIKLMTAKILDTFPDTHHSFIAFNKTYYNKKDKRILATNRFKETLMRLGYIVIEKVTNTKKEVVRVDGISKIHSYEECDMDGEIIHYIHTLGKSFSRIVLISGDSDMEPALKHIREEYGIEVWIISHIENMSNIYKDNYNTMGLDKLMYKGGENGFTKRIKQ